MAPTQPSQLIIVAVACLQVLKMDVEGFESNILAGGQQFFGAHNVYFMIVEANAGEHRRFRKSVCTVAACSA